VFALIIVKFHPGIDAKPCVGDRAVLAQLNAALPVPARATPELAAMLKAQNIANATAAITTVRYAGALKSRRRRMPSTSR
jgi:hypothetical protein